MAKRPKQLHERAWIRHVLDQYEEVEKLRPKLIQSMCDDWPDWVYALWAILLPVSHPGLKVENAKKWTARDLGRFLGRQSAWEGFVAGEVPLSPKVEAEKQEWINSVTDKNAPDPKALAAAEKLAQWLPQFRKFVGETLAAAAQRPYAERTVFLEAFGKANVIGPDDLSTERRIGVGERIAYVMAAFWRHIAGFESVAELHRFLSAAAKPMGLTITLKRVERLCSRIGLKFRDRGRPKKKNPTKRNPRV